MAERALADRVGAVEERFSRLENEVVEFRTEVREEFASLRVEVREGDEETRR